MLRKATIGDAERIGEIHVFGWRNAYRGIVTDEVLFGKLRVSKSAERRGKAIAEGLEETWVEEIDGIIRGFMSIGDPRDADLDPADFELWGIYVDPCFMRTGTGSRLVDLCEREAARRGRKDVFLWVLEDNALGRAFYRKLGYRPDGRRQLIESLGVWEVRYVKPVAAADAERPVDDAG